MKFITRIPLPKKEEWQWDGTYPVKCRIVDPTGDTIAPGITANAPERSLPHVDEYGVAELMEDGRNVRITLDSGEIIYGYQCWWRPVPPAEKEK